MQRTPQKGGNPKKCNLIDDRWGYAQLFYIILGPKKTNCERKSRKLEKECYICDWIEGSKHTLSLLQIPKLDCSAGSSSSYQHFGSIKANRINSTGVTRQTLDKKPKNSTLIYNSNLKMQGRLVWREKDKCKGQNGSFGYNSALRILGLNAKIKKAKRGIELEKYKRGKSRRNVGS